MFYRMASCWPSLALGFTVVVFGIPTSGTAADEPASALPTSILQRSAQIKNSVCLDCHSDKTLYKTNATGQAVSLFVDEKRFMSTVHKTNSCASCHADITLKHPDDD